MGIEKAIDVQVPVTTAYNQWTQFEEFPRFMEGVREVRQLDESRLHWVTEIGGRRKEWDVKITEQIPDRRIAWRSDNGVKNAGVVTFHRLDDRTTRVMLQVEYEPEGIVETVGDRLGFVARRVDGDLRRFKEFVETRGEETGAWRGTITRDRPSPAWRRALIPVGAAALAVSAVGLAVLLRKRRRAHGGGLTKLRENLPSSRDLRSGLTRRAMRLKIPRLSRKAPWP